MLNVGGNFQPGMIQLPFAQAELALALGHSEDALATLEAHAAWARADQYDLVLPENLYLVGRARMQKGEWDLAAEALNTACGLAAQMGARHILWQILAAQSQTERARGNNDAAEGCRLEAQSIVKEIAEAMPPEARQRFYQLPAVREVLA
jgi:hypothetical protein